MDTDDRTLVDRSRRGDSAAYCALVRRYQDRLYSTVYRMLGHADDALDAVQEAFLHAHQSLHSYKGDAQFYTWLYRIAVNAAISHRRKARVLLSGDLAANGHAVYEPPDRSVDAAPSDALERAEDERRLHAAIQDLTPEHRTVLVMKEIDGQKYEDIAEALGVPIGTVRSRLHRARVELRERLERDERSEDH